MGIESEKYTRPALYRNDVTASDVVAVKYSGSGKPSGVYPVQLYVGSGGTVILKGDDGGVGTHKNVPSGTTLDGEFAYIMAASTAFDFVAMWN